MIVQFTINMHLVPFIPSTVNTKSVSAAYFNNRAPL